MVGRALVLNASFEPLSVVASRRALVLVLSDKAELLHGTGHDLHSARAKFPEPSIVRLVNYVRVPHQARVAVTRRSVFVRDGHRCQYCGAQAENIDHVVPRSRGGTHSWDNVVACCRRCNSRKEDRLLDEAGFRLARTPGHRARISGCSPRAVRCATSGLLMSSPCSAGPSASERHAWPGLGAGLVRPRKAGGRRRAPPGSSRTRAGGAWHVCATSRDPPSCWGAPSRPPTLDARRLEAEGLELVRRRSGGGAVLVAPGCQVWIDLFLPSGDALRPRRCRQVLPLLGRGLRGRRSRPRSGPLVPRPAWRSIWARPWQRHGPRCSATPG